MRSVFISDLSHVTAGGLTSEFLPYGVGCIKSYFHKYTRSRDQYHIRLFQDPEAFIASYLADPPDVVAFLNYAQDVSNNEVQECAAFLAPDRRRRIASSGVEALLRTAD